jgi:NAD(P)-dependent dehydrogenase (short-subunit alcohol dehydrogenase family)
MDFGLDGKVAIVTGAAVGGIGEAYAHTLADAGASVVCADIRLDAAQAVADAITTNGGTALAVEVDIADRGSVDAMVASATGAYGGVDVLVNNAALMAQIVATPAIAYDLEQWNRAFAVNVTGAWQCIQAVVPSMSDRGGGRIVNQASVGAYPPESVYGITKLAVVGLTTTMARELGGSNITVNCIAPGMTQSDAGKMLTPEGSPFRAMVEARAAGKPFGEPTDLCGTLLLLTTPAGAWLTGQTIVVDGGFVMRP